MPGGTLYQLSVGAGHRCTLCIRVFVIIVPRISPLQAATKSVVQVQGASHCCDSPLLCYRLPAPLLSPLLHEGELDVRTHRLPSAVAVLSNWRTPLRWRGTT